MQQEVKFCIVCDSALGASTFVLLAMQLIQPMIMRLQEKYPGCKLTAGVVTYTTSTTRPAVVVRRAFCLPTALFPLFKGAPHLVGIGTTGLGGLTGMAMLEGIVAAIEMCDDVLESPARRSRTRHPDVAVQQPARPAPVFYVLLIGSPKIDQARRPLYNCSSALDDVTWETLPEELSKRNINLSLCITTPKDVKDQPILALHSKLWPSPDPVWFTKPKGYTVLLSGTHIPGASSKRPPEQTPSTGTPKRPKHDSPKPAPRPPPGRIDIPAPTFPPPTPPQAQPPAQAVPPPPPPTLVPASASVPAPVPPAPAPAASAPPQPPSISAPPPAAPSQTHTSPPLPTQPAVQPPPPPPQLNPPALAQSNIPPPGQISPQVLHLYRQIHLALRTPTTAADWRNKLMASGFRIDASGQLIGGAGVVFDARGEPGIGATVPPKVHAMAFERARAAAAQAGIVGAGVGGANGANAATIAQQAMAVQMMRIQQQRAAQGQTGGSQPQVQAQPGQLQSPQSVPPATQNSPPNNNPSPSLANRSPSHTYVQPPVQPVPGQGLPPQPPSIAGTPKQNNMGTPHVGMTPQHPGSTPQAQVAQTPQTHISSTPQAQVASTPQQLVSTPQQQPQTHGTPQQVIGTPQLVHATPQQSSPQNPNMSASQNPNAGGQPGLNINMPQNPNTPQNQNQNANAGGPQIPNTSAQNPNGPQTWKGQIVYLLRQRDDQAPSQLHFHAIAAGGPGHNIETHKWPQRLMATTGFKLLPRTTAMQLYSSNLPFGQIIIDPAHQGTDQQKHAVFYKVITAGYSIFYEFPHDPTDPLPPTAPAGSARGLLFFSTPSAPTRILFKVFLNQPCPAMLCRGGQPAGPGLMGSNGNGAAGTGAANGGGTVPNAMSATGVALPGASASPSASAVAGNGNGNGSGLSGVGGGLPGTGVGLPGTGLGGLPNGVNSMLGAQPSNPIPGSGIQGPIPGAGMIPSAVRPNPTPTPPNVNVNPASNPNPAMGINPAIMQSLNAGGIPGLGSAAMSGLAGGGVPGLGGAGLNPNSVPGLAQGNMSGLNPGNVPGLNGVNVPGLNQAALNAARQSQQTAFYQMAMARLGITPAQFASAPAPQKQQIMQQIQRLMIQASQQRQQQQQQAAVANGMGMAGMSARPGVAPGQPGFEQLQAFMRQQQQRQGGQ